MAFCPNCGSKTEDGAVFCGVCGKPVTQRTNQNEVIDNLKKYQTAPRRNEAVENLKRYQTAPAATPEAPRQAMRRQYASPAKKKGKGWIAVVSLVLAAAIVIGILGFRDGGWFRGKDGENTAVVGNVIKTETGKVSKDSPAVTLCGVTVDVDALMLGSGERDVSVSVYEGGEDTDGSRCDIYELEMGDHEDFRVPVEVTFPCDVESGADVVVEHYEDGAWKPLISFVDESEETVSAYFGSFSPVRVSYRKVGDNPSLYYTTTDEDNPYMVKMGVKSNYWEILKRTDPSEYTDEVKSFMGDPENFAVEFPTLDPKMDAKAAYEAFVGVNTMWPFCDAMINLGIETLPYSSQSKVVSFMIDHSGELGSAMNAIPFVAMATQVGFDLYTGGKDASDNAAINLYKNMLGSSGTIYSLATGYSHIGFTLAFVGVALFGMELDYFIDAAKEAKAENVAAVFNAYYSEIKPFDADHWYDVFVDAYWRSNGDADAAMREIKKAVDDYCGKFWTEVYKEGNDDIIFATDAAGYKNVFFNATDEQKLALTEQQKRKVWDLIESQSMPHIKRFLFARLQENTLKELAKATDLYNTELYFTIQESVDQQTTEVTKYKGCTICLGNAGVPIPELYWNVADDDSLDDGWEIEYECTRLGYLKMGMADQVLVYEDEEAYNNGDKPLVTKSFKLVTDGDRRTVIELGSGNTPATGAPEWLEGAWSHTAGIDDEQYSEFSRESVRITVIDEDTLLYEEYYYPNPGKPEWNHGVDYAFERQYYYDAKTDCVFILKTETGEFEGDVFPGVHDKGYLSPIRIERHPDKDSIHGCPAARFVQDPKEITGDEKTEWWSNLRFNRDLKEYDWTFNGTSLPEPETKGSVTEWTVKDDSVTIRLDGLTYDEFKAYCGKLQAMSGWKSENDEDTAHFPADYNDRDKVYFTGSYKNLPHISAQYYSDSTVKGNGLPHFVIFVFTEW